jgi:hypothetical protein
MPSRPRYSVPRGVLEVVSGTDGVTRAGADTVVLPDSITMARWSLDDEVEASETGVTRALASSYSRPCPRAD